MTDPDLALRKAVYGRINNIASVDVQEARAICLIHLNWLVLSLIRMAGDRDEFSRALSFLVDDLTNAVRDYDKIKGQLTGAKAPL